MKLSAKTWTMDELMAEGEASLLQHCAPVTSLNGQGFPQHFRRWLVRVLLSVTDSNHIDISRER